MSRGWKARIFPLVLCGIFGIACLTHGNTSEREQEHFVLTYAEIQSEDYPTTQSAKYFADLVQVETGGRIEIVVKAGGELGSEHEIMDQVRYGGIDLTRLSLSQMSDLIPEYSVLQLPYLYENSDHMWQVLNGKIGESFLEKASEAGLVGLSWYDGGVRSFYTTEKPITCLEDFEGMEIRVQESEIMESMINALGAHAVKVPYTEVYSYLERGMVDGAENNWPSYESMEHCEVAKYYTEDEHSRIPEIQLASGHTWEKLSPEDQEIIRNAAKKSAEYMRMLWQDQVDSSRRKAIGQGTVVVEISEEEKEKIRDAVSVIYDDYCCGQTDVIEQIRKMAEQ